MKKLDLDPKNELNEALTVIAGWKGPGGANHAYKIEGPDGKRLNEIKFQFGPVKENGVNGVSNEALIAILIDRMEGFEAGEFACKENRDALRALRFAKKSLDSRTKKRIERGVEGTMQK